MLSQAPEPASKTLQRAILIFSAFRQLEGVPRALPLPHKNLSWGRWRSGLKLSHRVPPPAPMKETGHGAEEGRCSHVCLRPEDAQDETCRAVAVWHGVPGGSGAALVTQGWHCRAVSQCPRSGGCVPERHRRARAAAAALATSCCWTPHSNFV